MMGHRPKTSGKQISTRAHGGLLDVDRWRGVDLRERLVDHGIMVPAVPRDAGQGVPTVLVYDAGMLHRRIPAEGAAALQQGDARGPARAADASSSWNVTMPPRHRPRKRNSRCRSLSGTSRPDSLSAEKWLDAHNPDAAILDVKLKDEAPSSSAKADGA